MRAQGQIKPAIARTERVLSFDGVPYMAFERVAYDYVRQRDFNSAANTLTAAERRYGGPDVTWPDRIMLYRAAENATQVANVLKNCGASEDSRQRSKCDEAARRTVDLVD